MLAEGTKAGTEWSEDLPAAVAAYNKTQHGAVHGRPDKVGKEPIQEFLVLQDNADKAQHNLALQTLRESKDPRADLLAAALGGGKIGFGLKW